MHSLMLRFVQKSPEVQFYFDSVISKAGPQQEDGPENNAAGVKGKLPPIPGERGSSGQLESSDKQKEHLMEFSIFIVAEINRSPSIGAIIKKGQFNPPAPQGTRNVGFVSCQAVRFSRLEAGTWPHTITYSTEI
ncbi:hypothetical protein RUM43_012017 [Polyplax serrata]|uniref:Uncharacterized protein n=1 Tax=Polyplax serrata TaxID=468196 RepID=A0AAN8P2X5_POLSC